MQRELHDRGAQPLARGHQCRGNPWQESDFDNKFWTSAGQDESGAWQEFGEMRFTSQDTISDAFGPKHINPLHARGNWATTRYMP